MAKLNGNGNKIFWSIFSVVTALTAGFSLFAGKIIVSNNREVGQNTIRIDANTKAIERNINTMEEFGDAMHKLEIGLELLIREFNLEKEYREKLDEKEKEKNEDSH